MTCEYYRVSLFTSFYEEKAIWIYEGSDKIGDKISKNFACYIVQYSTSGIHFYFRHNLVSLF